MKQRNNRLNNGYIGKYALFENSGGIVGANKDYLNNVSFTPGWTRPSDWLQMPYMVEGDQKIAGLYAVYPGGSGATGATASGNFIAVVVHGTTYVVDWGVGVTTRHTTGTTAQYSYTFDGVSADTLTTEGFRQAMFQITPEIAGRTFSGVEFGRRYTVAGVTHTAPTGVISLKVCSNTMSGCTLSWAPGFLGTTTLFLLREFEYVGESRMTSVQQMFEGCNNLCAIYGDKFTKNATIFQRFCNGLPNLQVISPLDTRSGTLFNIMFGNCVRLENVPYFDTSRGNNFNQMFGGCSSLRQVPSFITFRGTDFSSMFIGCLSLKNVPLLNLSAATTTASMFSGCTSLIEVPNFNTQNVISMANMFDGCTVLRYVPPFNTQNVTNFSTMFNNCYSLAEVPDFNYLKATNTSNMFNTCRCLRETKPINAPNCNNFSGMFANTGLQYFAGLTTGTPGVNYSSMFQGSTRLTTVKNFNGSGGYFYTSTFASCTCLTGVIPLDATGASGAIGLSQVFFSCPSLKFGVLTGCTATVSYSGCNLSPAALNDIFTGLGTGGAGKTITITGNWGASGCNRTIATGKGWSITG